MTATVRKGDYRGENKKELSVLLLTVPTNRSVISSPGHFPLSTEDKRRTGGISVG